MIAKNGLCCTWPKQRSQVLSSEGSIESLVKGYSLSGRSKTKRTKQVILDNIRTLQEFLIGIVNRTNHDKMNFIFKHSIKYINPAALVNRNWPLRFTKCAVYSQNSVHHFMFTNLFISHQNAVLLSYSFNEVMKLDMILLQLRLKYVWTITA